LLVTVINKAVEMIKKNRNIDIDFSKVDLEDEATYQLLSRGETLGIFQLESSGLRAIIKDLQPEHFEDIIALVALYRPGPLGSGMVEDFIKRKHKEKRVEYLHPVLEPVLNNTYGVIIYQEQVMRIASEMAGFSLGEADLLRRAMGKKKKEIIEGLKKQFTEGAKKKNISEDISRKVFELIEYFAGYGFNKSHSAAYALISFQTAYLKTHYPHEYMAALLSSIMDSQEKVNFYINEATRMGIKVLPPDINQSGETFEAVGNQIVFGLVAVKNVGKNAIEAIHRARKEGGTFTSIQDFATRVDLSVVNRRTIESLIKAGAFGSINSNRAQLLQMLDPCYCHGQSIQKDLNSSQVSLFEIGEDAGFDIKDVVIESPDTEDFSDKEKLALEKEYLGFYVSGHPLDEYKGTIKKRVKYQISDLPNLKDRTRTRIAGIITKAERKPTKKGQTMAYCTLEDLSGEIDVLVFPSTLEKYYDLVGTDRYVMIDGSLQLQEDGVKFFAEKISELIKEKDDILILEFKEKPADNKIFTELQSLFLSYKGDTQVILRFPDLKKEMILPRENWVNTESGLIKELIKYRNILDCKKE
jgi:DNA polymerase-3 subunit alpha